MAVFDAPDFDNHEKITFFCDADSGLRAIVAIHTSSVFGASGGGCRMVPYATPDEALRDVLRLSRAMTYKLALAGIPAGGAKTVVIGDPAKDKSEALLRALGRAVHSLGGRYIIAEDVGTTPDDMEIIASQTPYVVGRKQGSGDTGPATGYGVFVALRSAVAHALGRADLQGLRVAVQGLGAVGYNLCRHLHLAGAQLWVADPRVAAVERAVAELGAKTASCDSILALDVDVVAPCALGGVLDDASIPRLRCKVIAGGANNQLADEARHGRMLHDRGIVFTPDFVANMGGVLGAAAGAGVEEAKVFAQVDKIATVLDQVFELARREGTTTNEAAVTLAKAAVARLHGR
jgi:leucine dehydrogenase